MKINKTDNKVLRTIRKYNMFKKGDRVLVGLSGGKDSVVLLNVLNNLSSVLKIELVAFHLNHGIRGEEANKDEAFSREFSKTIGVKFVSSYRDVPKMTELSCDSLETVAREIRYKEFQETAMLEGCNKIATAHTSSDNVETFFITLLRHGNSKFIPPVRDNIVRPLIEISTEEVLEYARENDLSFVTDSTNFELSYTRNYVRKKIIPLFKEKSPSFEDSISKNSDLFRSYEALCQVETDKYFASTKQPLAIHALNSLNENFAYRNVLYSVLNKEALKFNITLTYSKFCEICELLKNGRTGQKVDLSEKVFVRKTYECLEFSDLLKIDDLYEFVIIKGKNVIPNSNLTLYLETPEEYSCRIHNNEQQNKKINKLTKNILFKYNIINSSLVARSRRVGDEFLSEGINRNIKKYMINEKIPSDLRNKIPIICDNEGIIWVPGLRMADRLKESEGDLFSLSLEFEY